MPPRQLRLRDPDPLILRLRLRHLQRRSHALARELHGTARPLPLAPAVEDGALLLEIKGPEIFFLEGGIDQGARHKRRELNLAFFRDPGPVVGPSNPVQREIRFRGLAVFGLGDVLCGFARDETADSRCDSDVHEFGLQGEGFGAEGGDEDVAALESGDDGGGVGVGGEGVDLDAGGDGGGFAGLAGEEYNGRRGEGGEESIEDVGAQCAGATDEGDLFESHVILGVTRLKLLAFRRWLKQC